VAQELGAGRRRLWLVFGLLVAGVVLALANTNAQTDLVRRRGDTCDGSLPLPTLAYLEGFAGLLAGVAALFLLARWFRHSREPIVLVLFATGAAAVVFEVLAVVTAFQEGRPVYPMCEG
jgi:hypothetical protein